MPLGRIYQPPAVPRNTPVYRYNGVKAANTSQLVVTGKAVRPLKSKSPSPEVPSKVANKQFIARKAPLKKKTLINTANNGSSERVVEDNFSLKDIDSVLVNGHSSEENGGNGVNTRNGQSHESKEWSPCNNNNDTENNNNGDILDDTIKRNKRLQNGYSEDDGPSTNNSSDSNNSSQTGYNGLRNIGNTCFMNSVLQCLSNTKPLLEYITQDEYTRDINTSNSSMKGALVKAFANVIKNLWKGTQRTPVDPSSFKGAMQRYAPRFSGYNQEDSQEFLRYLLEGLHEDVNRVITKPLPINSEIDSSLSVCEQAMEAWKRYIRRDDSQLVDQFVGQLKSTLRCSQCGYESVTFEAFWDLSLPIPGRTDCSLQDCFDAFTREEILDGDEMPTCERCKIRRKCTKWYRVYKFPKILVIHLKRFSPNERHRSKLSALVDFPLQNLDLGSYTDSATRSTFNCYGVSNHSGTLYSGHYTATARHPYNGNWSTFSDASVSKLTTSSSVISKEAYLLFFELL